MWVCVSGKIPWNKWVFNTFYRGMNGAHKVLTDEKWIKTLFFECKTILNCSFFPYLELFQRFSHSYFQWKAKQKIIFSDAFGVFSLNPIEFHIDQMIAVFGIQREKYFFFLLKLRISLYSVWKWFGIWDTMCS